MARKPYLSQQSHDAPPKFNAPQRQRYLYIDTAFEEQVLSKVRGAANKVFCALAYSYFKVTYQFFEDAEAKDLKYLARRFDIQKTLNWQEYHRDTRNNHRAIILEFMGFKSFNTPDSTTKATEIINRYARVKKNFRDCFCHLASELRREKIEIPSYNLLKSLIDKCYKNHKAKLLSIVENELTSYDKAILDQLFDNDLPKDSQAIRYRLTLLKKFTQSLKPNKISKNIAGFDVLYDLFLISAPIVEKLDLNGEGIRHYATSVNKSQIFQIQRKKDPNRYLHLITFVVHQFYRLHDILVDTLNASVTSAYNIAERQAKEHYYKIRNEQSKKTKTLLEQSGDMFAAIEKAKGVLMDESLDDAIKVAKALKLLTPKSLNSEQIINSMEEVKSDLDRLSGEGLLYYYLEDGSLKLQRRCNDIVKRLKFSEQSVNKPLLSAINRFKKYQGKVDHRYPIRFLSKEERKYVDTDDEFKSKLYKVALFKHISDSLKGDSLFLEHSYRYRCLDEYLISLNVWEKNKRALLKQAGMLKYIDFKALIKELGLELHQQYQETNEHILENSNDYVTTKGFGEYRLTSQRNTYQEESLLDSVDIELFPKNSYVTISEVLNTVHQATGFLDEFQHHNDEYLKERPDDNVFIASTVGLGLHFSPEQFTKLSRSVNNSALVTTINNYMSVENSRLASDKILEYVKSMPLAGLYIGDFGLQTSSDGQKWTVSKDSFNSNYSFKYGGKDPVLAAYNFVDTRHLFYHSNVISGAEREAHYMIDGVMKNDVVKSDMHSTDTHGYTEMVFGISHLLDISFAPRIKNIHRQNIYSLKGKKAYTSKNYPILPRKQIRLDRIEPYWDDILRLCVSIKLGEATASQIFKRLNSYSVNNNPLYKAIKEFGRIPKSHYILRYIDDPELRSAVHKQLNKGESGNKLDRALAIGRSEYAQVEKEDQEAVESCKRVIKNAIVCWNYMYLTQKVMNARSKAEKEALINKIKLSSPVTWEHILLHGVFDFSENKLRDSRAFDFEKMHDPKILKT
ncbi:Tn3 family transposase [Aliikangiella marina]|uniref:Tn3 family transposase n=1 Tax=Aliikangiella marina TaxID=1712262 RepID=A0A545TJD3_9GAMM|nr:Tn3 family transposase [Aliikangiella marina]TQV77323.1 Tn3 family transposase [Aliikangiella marina]